MSQDRDRSSAAMIDEKEQSSCETKEDAAEIPLFARCRLCWVVFRLNKGVCAVGMGVGVVVLWWLAVLPRLLRRRRGEPAAAVAANGDGDNGDTIDVRVIVGAVITSAIFDFLI